MITALVAATAVGCSLFVSGPPAPPRPKQYCCTESRVAPVLDTVAAVSAVLVAAMVSVVDEDAGTPVLIVAAGYGAAAYGGYQRTGRCRAARAEERSNSARQ
jgi:hypothetical protein